MAVHIQARPESVSTGYAAGVLQSTLYSKWIAVRNPVVYRMLRRDHQYTAIQDNAGFCRFIIPGANVTAYYSVGCKIVWWQNGNILDSRILTVTGSVYNGGSVWNEITVDLAYIGAGVYSGYLVNQSKRTDYKIQVNVIGIGSVSLTENLVKFDYYPDTFGRMVVDISEVLRQFAIPKYEKLTTINGEEPSSYLPFWIEYQEFYDGALQGAVIPDSNIHYAIAAAQQVYYRNQRIVTGSNMTDYVIGDDTKKFLRRFEKQSLKMWRGFPFTLSFIWPRVTGSLDVLYLIYYETDATKAVQPWQSVLLTPPINLIDRLHHVRLSNLVTLPTTKYLIAKLGFAISFPNANGGPINSNVIIDLNLGTMLPPGTYNFSGTMSIQISGAPAGGTIGLNYKVRNSGTAAFQTVAPGSLSAGDSLSGPLTQTRNNQVYTPIISFDQIRLEFTYTVANNFIWSYSGISISGPDRSETVTIEVMEPRDNAVMLFWKNSLGGDSWWMFERNAEKKKQLSGNRKATRLNLFADQVTDAEWEAIDELNAAKETYGTTFSELSSAVTRTQTQLDQDANIVDAAGDGTGVIVVSKSSRTETVRQKHDIEIEIELPSDL